MEGKYFEWILKIIGIGILILLVTLQNSLDHSYNTLTLVSS